MNSETIQLNLTRLPTPGPVPLNLTRLGIPGPVTLNLTGLPIPGPTPLNLTNVPIPKTLPATRYHVSYFLLALQWPGAYHNQCPYNRRAAFLIHGLWPQPRMPGLPSRDRLYLPQRGPLITELKSMWPSIRRPCQNRRFWECEWRSHGAFSNLGGQSNYFRKTLNLRGQLRRQGHDPLTVLRENNIIPRAPQPYSATLFRSALGRVLTGFGEIQCVRASEIAEIYLCVNREASDFIRCPGRVNINSRCETDVFFLP